ncbi:MAG: knotted carbamoyltransferase YgeW [Spirochaetaceae bacterium]|nr:MAG: knotted carbamoyltransferase YgeW [Spirochaetaceae bacterium]
MDKTGIERQIDALEKSEHHKMFGGDFLLTWQKSEDELRAVLAVSETLKQLRSANISPRVFDSGLAVSLFRDNSTRTRFSFASAANLLGLAVQDLDEAKSQIAHGETVRETAVMISFLSEVIGIRDDMYLGAGHEYMVEVGESLSSACNAGLLERRPAIVNLQCDRDHPTQAMADLQHLANEFGGVDKLRGKKIAMTWAYSPSYGKPLSVPQGIIGLMTRFGMDVRLAYPEGYNLIPEIEQHAAQSASQSGGSFSVSHSMDEAFADADIVYPKSWAPYHVMQQRTDLLRAGDSSGLASLEQSCLAMNKRFIDWECTEEKMKQTAGGRALYMHCLPADISGVSCERGEVAADVFEAQRDATYREAGYKPYIIAAMILMAKFKQPATVLRDLLTRNTTRVHPG